MTNRQAWIKGTICAKCGSDSCPGPDELRHFDNWTDLHTHITEGDIVMFVNRLAEIIDDYLRLKDADDSRRLAARTRTQYNKALYNWATNQLSADEKELLLAKAAEVAEKPTMRSVGKGRLLHIQHYDNNTRKG